MTLTVLFLMPGALCRAASGRDEFRVKREALFAFAEPPAVTRSGDRVTIRFATKGYCDVTVAIEDSAGRIVRHLACGVLGPKAPPPLEKNSERQTIVWDGKDDLGAYVDDKDRITIRVSSDNRFLAGRREFVVTTLKIRDPV